MKKHQTKGIVVILALALVLGLGTSAFSQKKPQVEVEARLVETRWEVGLNFGMGFPMVKGFFGKDYNDQFVPYINQELQNLGDDAQIDTAEKIDSYLNAQLHVRRRITDTLWAQIAAGGLWGMNSDWGYNLHYVCPDLEEPVVENYTADLSVSGRYVSLGLGRRWGCEKSPLHVDLWAGPIFQLGRMSFNERLQRDGELSGSILDLDSRAPLEGSDLGIHISVKGVYENDGVTYGVYAGWRTGEIKVTGDRKTTDRGIPFLSEAMTAILDFNSFEFGITVEISRLPLIITPHIVQEDV